MSINNEEEFKFEQNHKTYSINISIQDDQLSLILILISNPLKKYSGFFSLNELRISSKIFEHTKTLFEAKEIIKRTVIKKQLLIDEDEFRCRITFDTGLGHDSVPFPITLFRDSDDKHPRISFNNPLFKINNRNINPRNNKDPEDNLKKSFINKINNGLNINYDTNKDNKSNNANTNNNNILRASIGNNINNKMLNNNLNISSGINGKVQFNNSMKVLTTSKIYLNSNQINPNQNFKEVDLRNNMNNNNKIENGLNKEGNFNNNNTKNILALNNNILYNIYNNMNNNHNINSSFYKDLSRSFALANQNNNTILKNNNNIYPNKIIQNNKNINNNPINPIMKKDLRNIDNNYSMYQSNIYPNHIIAQNNNTNNSKNQNMNNNNIPTPNVNNQNFNNNLLQNITSTNPTLIINNQSFHTAPVPKNVVQIPNMDTQINPNLLFNNNNKRKTYNRINNKNDNMRLSLSDASGDENNDNINPNLDEYNTGEQPYRFKNLLIQGSKKVKGNLEKFKKNQNIGDYVPEGTKFVSYLKFPDTKNTSNKSLTLSTISSSITSGSNRVIGIEKNIIKHPGELDEITSRLQRILNKKNIKYRIIFRSNIDGDTATSFHEKCDHARNTLILIKATGNKRFGGFTTQTWDGEDVNKKDNNCFIFSIDKMKIYDVIEGQNAINCNPDLGPVFISQIKLLDKFFTQGGTTSKKGKNFMTLEDFEITGGAEKFGVQEVEVYQIK